MTTRDVTRDLGLLDALFASAPLGLAVFDLEGRFTRVNDVLREINGCSAEEHLGRTIPELLPALGGRLHDVLMEVLASGKPAYDVEVSGRTLAEDDGGERTWLDTFFRLHDEAGVPVGAACIVVDVTRQRRAERERTAAHELLTITARASELLAGSLDPRETLERLCDVLVPALGDHAFVDIREEGGRLRRAAIRHSTGIVVAPDLVHPVGMLSDYAPGHPVRIALEQGQRRLVPAFSGEPAAIPVGRDTEFVDQVGARSAMVLPMIVAGRVIGAVSLLSSRSGRRFGPDDLQLAQDVVSRAGVAVANALSYEQQRSAAVALQRSLLPVSLSAVEALEVAWRYFPGTAGTEVGGDWVDVFELPGGRVAVVVGDVMGRGLRAAAVMGQLRTAVRTLAGQDPPPRDLLARLDEIVAGLPVGQIVTCVYAVYDPARDAVCLANAGHLPPLLLTDGGAGLVETPVAVPLGVGGVEFEQTEVQLPPGAVLALYTDGLVERPGSDLDAAIAQLADVLAAPLGKGGFEENDLERRCALLLAQGPTAGTEEYDDDVALLLVRPRPEAAGDVVLRRLPIQPESVAVARREVVAALRGAAPRPLPPDVEATAELLTSELVTNAVHYATGEVELVVRCTTRALWVEVSDDDTRLPRLRKAAPEEDTGRGLALVSALASAWGTRPTLEGKVVWFRLDL